MLTKQGLVCHNCCFIFDLIVVDQKVVPSVAANMVDSFGYDRHDQLQRVRTRVRVRSVELKEGKRHRMKRDAYRNGGSERYVYVMFDLE